LKKGEIIFFSFLFNPPKSPFEKRGNGRGIWRVGVDFMKGGKFGKENSSFKGV